MITTINEFRKINENSNSGTAFWFGRIFVDELSQLIAEYYDVTVDIAKYNIMRLKDLIDPKLDKMVDDLTDNPDDVDLQVEISEYVLNLCIDKYPTLRNFAPFYEEAISLIYAPGQ